MAELDLLELEADLYGAWKALERDNYGSAEAKVAKSWRVVHEYRLAEDDEINRRLPGTEDLDAWARVVKVLYWLLNKWPLKCDRLGFYCHWQYPYGFVPEGGCPYHD